MCVARYKQKLYIFVIFFQRIVLYSAIPGQFEFSLKLNSSRIFIYMAYKSMQ